MNKELAKTLTTALVQWIDKERQEGTMCCSSYECERIEKAFMDDRLDIVDGFIKKKLSRLTEFQNAIRIMITEALTAHIKDGNGGETSSTVFIDDDTAILLAERLLELSRKELLSRPDESNPAIEAMADLERTFECNPEKLPLWLKEALAERYQKGYYEGRKDGLEEYNKSVVYRYETRPLCWEPGGTCTNPQMDCVNCPRKTTGGGLSTSSGTSTLKAEG